MTKTENEQSAHDIIRQWFIEQYKIDFGTELLHSNIEDSSERLRQYVEWEPDYGQRAQADANTQQIMERLAYYGLTIDVPAPVVLPANICTTDLSTISTVETTPSTDYANELIQDGWTILHVGIDTNGSPVYMLGLPYEGIE